VAKMTIKEYVKKGGFYCPVCREQTAMGIGPFTAMGKTGSYMQVHCDNPDCGATWDDEYTLKRFCNLNKGTVNA
tara:strand:+ start:25688 stop:25909 length:222 start_codon:yes stop_codon:yes gene_type:complete